MLDEIAFCIGGGFPTRVFAHTLALRFYRRHPAWAHRNPRTHALESAFSVHFDIEAAKSAGLPYPYDMGAQRNMWLITLLTNWAGDDGFLKRAYAEYRRFFYYSDVLWMNGKVVNKYIDENKEYAVDIEISTVNQRHEEIMPGKAVVLLPSRSGYHPLDTRLRK